MPERQSHHPDNELIDEPAQTPGQQGSSGGQMARSIAKRAEEKALGKGDAGERVRGSDHPRSDARKGEKTLSRTRGGG